MARSTELATTLETLVGPYVSPALWFAAAVTVVALLAAMLTDRR